MSRQTVYNAPFKFFLFHFFSFHVFFVDGLRPPAEQVNYIFKWIMIVFELYFVCRVVIQPCVKYLVCIAILRLKFVYYYMQSTHTHTQLMPLRIIFAYYKTFYVQDLQLVHYIQHPLHCEFSIEKPCALSSNSRGN